MNRIRINLAWWLRGVAKWLNARAERIDPIKIPRAGDYVSEGGGPIRYGQCRIDGRVLTCSEPDEKTLETCREKFRRELDPSGPRLRRIERTLDGVRVTHSRCVGCAASIVCYGDFATYVSCPNLKCGTETLVMPPRLGSQ